MSAGTRLENEIIEVDSGTTITPLENEPERLIELAIKKNVSVESLERLLAMRDKIIAERARSEFIKALAAFQRDCPTVEKKKKVNYENKTGGRTKYNYAPIEEIAEQVKDLLSKNGFAYNFDTETNGKMKVVCKIYHSGGHMESIKVDMEIEETARMNVMQKYGSALTYAKRYAFCSALGINVKDEDTDALSDEKPPKNDYMPSRTPSSVIVGKTISPLQMKKVFALLKEKNITNEELHEQMKVYFKKSSLKDLSSVQANKLIDSLDKAEKREEFDVDKIDEGIEEMKAEQI